MYDVINYACIIWDVINYDVIIYDVIISYFFSFPFKVREDNAPSDTNTANPNSIFGTFDPSIVRKKLSGANYSDYVNPLVTSMECLNRDLFRVNFSISGSDILSPLREDNSDFYEYNHVLVPYCSSDLWIGESESNQEECDCGDLDCFNYTANAENLQFAFRGKIIFQSIFRQLMEKHGMDQADEILLGGSSAGGVGILNNAQWVREEMPPGADLLLVSESSWFINFQGSINQVFEGVG